MVFYGELDGTGDFYLRGAIHRIAFAISEFHPGSDPYLDEVRGDHHQIVLYPKESTFIDRGKVRVGYIRDPIILSLK